MSDNLPKVKIDRLQYRVKWFPSYSYNGSSQQKEILSTGYRRRSDVKKQKNRSRMFSVAVLQTERVQDDRSRMKNRRVPVGYSDVLPVLQGCLGGVSEHAQKKD